MLLVFGLGNRCMAETINILWYSYALDGSAYKTYLLDIAAWADTWPQGAGIKWNITFFGPGDPAPDFAAYDVLVVHGAEAQWSGDPAPDPTKPREVPDYSGILANKAAIMQARGERTFISGSDADFHAARGDTGHTPQFVSDYFEWDGAIGYLINCVNWAAMGAGMGVVSLYHGEQGPNAYWWYAEGSFLKDELGPYVVDFHKDYGFGARDNYPLITPGTEAYALNGGLTADGRVDTLDGLENWQWSFHGGFAHGIPGYAGLQDSTKHPGYYVSIATEAFAHMGATPPLIGDLNVNGRLDAGNLLICMRIVLGDIEPSAAQRERADIGPLDRFGLPAPDGVIDAGDLLALRQKVLLGE